MLHRLRKSYLTSKLIRNAIDGYPGGICFAALDGRPILVNRKMNEICYQLTGATVTNTEAMWQELICLSISQGSENADGANSILCRLNDKSIWQFQKKLLEINKAQVTQFEASDITELYEYQNRLVENNLHVSQLHSRQRELLKNIVQNNLDKELLGAKMRIHDNFGRLLIMTKSVLSEESSESSTRDLFAAWENVITDMENASISVDVKETSPQDELIQVADLIGCRVTFTGKQPSSRKALLLLYAAIREALTNAVRHAGADGLTVAITDGDDNYLVRISSNGRSASSPIREGSGLTNLRKRLEQEGATLNYDYKNGVALILTIPKE